MIDVKLEEYLDECRQEHFEWGVKDCALFAADWCQEHVGINPALGSHREYETELGAYKHLKEKYGSLINAFDAHFNQIDAPFAQKGDIALCDVDGRETMGIIGARGFVFFKAMPIGIQARKNPKILTAWRVE